MWPYLRQVSGLLTIGSLAGIAMNTAVVLPAVLLGHAVDTVLAVAQGRAGRADLAWAVGWLIAGTLATEVPRVGKRFWLGVARARIRAAVRADAQRGVLRWPAERLHQTPVGDLMARIIGDVEVLGTGIGEIIVETWDTLLFSVSLAVAMVVYDPQLALLALLPVPAALLLAKAAGRRVTNRTVRARRANAELTGFISEHLTGLRVLRVFGRTGEAVATFRGLAAHQADAELAATRLAAVLQPIYGTLTAAGMIAVISVGGHRVASGAMTVGALVAFLQLFTRFAARAWRIPQMANRVQAGAAAFTRLHPLLAPPVTAADLPRQSRWTATYVPAPAPATGRPPERAPGGATVNLDGVSFTYPGGSSLALSDITMKAAAGTLLAVTGPVGSGKTALAHLIAGLHAPGAGRVRVDGRDPRTWTDADRAILGYLPQGHPVFSGSITGNLLLDNPDADAETVAARLADAIGVASLSADIDAMPARGDTQIGEGGVRVSGGQRQRIALARALAAPSRAPRLLVLDDPFSAVDVDTEAAIIAALRVHTGPKAPGGRQATVVLCSTRLAAFRHADHILVLDHGQLRERGTHPQLLAANGLYARIYRAQQRIDRPARRP